ncbi:hypothetical protein EV421DRAFT_2025317 [Armillaria borealis]|uniref:Protein kinase domain-containing protein n=1 Tax=Armillaria borealis TaxID=47425 RepID=A0AA39ITF7_9AGAR|nr:hypothetical protein EV421DRAFT_2025317 [Armillaria borealis]
MPESSSQTKTQLPVAYLRQSQYWKNALRTLPTRTRHQTQVRTTAFASNEWTCRDVETLDGDAEARLKVESYGERDFASNDHVCLETIGRGAYGSVCKGTHIPTKDVVAQKTVDLNNVDDDIGDIQREVVLLSQLRKWPQHYQVFRLLDGQP